MRLEKKAGFSASIAVTTRTTICRQRKSGCRIPTLYITEYSRHGNKQAKWHRLYHAFSFMTGKPASLYEIAAGPPDSHRLGGPLP